MLTPTGRGTHGRRGKDSPLWVPLVLAAALAIAMVSWIVVKEPSGGAQQSAAPSRFRTTEPLANETPTRTRTRSASPTPTAAIELLPPDTVEIDVLNSTDISGLANKAANQLQGRGFAVGKIGNAGKNVDVAGVGQIRFGPEGKRAAATVKAYLPDAVLVGDSRKGSTVQLILGPDYTDVQATPASPADELSGDSDDPNSGVGSTTD